jgi:hypothetical protein
MKKNEQIALRLQWALHPALLPAALLATVLSVTACGGGSQSNAPTTPVATVVAATPVVLQASPPGALRSYVVLDRKPHFPNGGHLISPTKIFPIAPLRAVF